MNLSPDQIRGILIRLFVLIASVAFHEFGHAYMADRLGDDTPRRQGRVTLNPIAHIDPIGTLLLPLIGGVYAAAGSKLGGFGWGKPVEWNPPRITRKVSMATAKILVAFAGPFMNIVLAVMCAGVHSILLWRGVVAEDSQVSNIFYMAVSTNFILFFFNLLPAPPLDGGHVLEGFMPYRYRAQFDAYAKYGMFIVAAFVIFRPLAQIFLVPAKFCAVHLYGLFGIHLF